MKNLLSIAMLAVLWIFPGWARCEAPFAFTEPATLVKGETSQLNGMATPNGLDSLAWFEWGTSSAYSNRTGARSVGNGTGVVWFTNRIEQLVPYVNYHFRLVVSNGIGVAYGADQQFGVGKRVVCWGGDSYGQCDVPTNLSDVVAVSGGYQHSVALKSDGTVVCWGQNDWGQATSPYWLANAVAIAAGGSNSLALLSDGTVRSWGNYLCAPPEVWVASDIVAVAAGEHNCFLLKRDGTLAAYGRGYSGETYVPEGLSNVVAVAAGRYHAVAIRNDGSLLVWGSSGIGQPVLPPYLGGATALSVCYDKNVVSFPGGVFGWEDWNFASNLGQGLDLTSIATGTSCALWLSGEGMVQVLGVGTSGESDVPAGLNNVLGIAAGMQHFMAVTTPIPSVTSKTVVQRHNHDLPVQLDGFELGGSSLTLRISRLPDVGAVYQVGQDGKGPLISTTNTMVSDPGQSVVFVCEDHPANVSSTSFDFVANDGVSDSLAATVTVIFTNIAPVAMPLTNASARFLTAPITLSGTDQDGDSLTFRITSFPSQWVVFQYSNGIPGDVLTPTNAWVNDSAGRIFISPVSGPSTFPSDSFQFVANDGVLDSDPAIVLITNSAPVATSFIAAGATPNADVLVTLAGVDSDGDPLKYRVVSLPGRGALYQYVDGVRGDVIQITNTWVSDSGGRLFFAPEADTYGNKYTTFQYVANDGVAESTAGTVTINVGFYLPRILSSRYSLTNRSDLLMSLFLDTGHLASTAWVEWETTWNDKQVSEPIDLRYSQIMATCAIKNLPTNTYSARWGVSNVLGVTYGNPITIEILPPTVSATRCELMNNFGANLLATVISHSFTSKAWFAWGETTNYTSFSKPVDIGAGATKVALGLNMIGLPQGRYHCCLVASNDFGTIYGPDTTFAFLPPMAVTLPASFVTGTSANLRGVVAPNYAPCSVWFEWGTTKFYGNTASPQSQAGFIPAPTGDPGATHSIGTPNLLSIDGKPGRTAAISHLDNVWSTNLVYFTNRIDGLLPGMLCHYRLVASNSLGVCYGPDQVFGVGQQIQAWGDNYYGQTNLPDGLTNAIGIACGFDQCFAIRSAPPGAAWGRNSNGETRLPTNLNNVIQFAGGDTHSMALLGNGRVVAWGNNTFGQTNVPAIATNIIGITAGADHNLAVQASGAVVSWGANQAGQCMIPTGLKQVIAVAAGNDSSLALKADGSAVAWGDNQWGQTNIPQNATNLISIAAGQEHFMALRSDGAVIVWGDDSCGQISELPPNLTNVVAIASGGFHCLALKADGTVVAWGFDWDGETDIPVGLTNVVEIAAGQYHSLALSGNWSPSILTEPATGVTLSSAVLNGLVGPNGLPSGGWFEWGTSTSYGNIVPISTVGAGTSLVTLSASIGSLNQGTDYHYRLVATNSAGLSHGNDVVFTTGVPSILITRCYQDANEAGVFHIEFSGPTNAFISAWASTNLVDWDWIGTSTEISPGLFQFDDNTSTNYPTRFYQVRRP